MLNYDAKTLSFPEVMTEDSAYASHRIAAGPALQFKYLCNSNLESCLCRKQLFSDLRAFELLGLVVFTFADAGLIMSILPLSLNFLMFIFNSRTQHDVIDFQVY